MKLSCLASTGFFKTVNLHAFGHAVHILAVCNKPYRPMIGWFPLCAALTLPFPPPHRSLLKSCLPIGWFLPQELGLSSPSVLAALNSSSILWEWWKPLSSCHLSLLKGSAENSCDALKGRLVLNIGLPQWSSFLVPHVLAALAFSNALKHRVVMIIVSILPNFLRPSQQKISPVPNKSTIPRSSQLSLSTLIHTFITRLILKAFNMDTPNLM